MAPETDSSGASTCRILLAARISLTAMVGLFLAGSGAGLGTLALPPNDASAPLAIMWVFVALPGGLAIAWCWRWRLRLDAETLVVTGLWRTHTVRRQDVAGRRCDTLVLADGTRVGLASPRERDAALEAWWASLPDLEARDRTALQSAVEADPRLGATPGERDRAIVRARRASRVLLAVTGAAAAWGSLVAEPNGVVVAVLVALPWAGLAAILRWHRHPLLLQEQRRPRFAGPVVVPGLVLAARAALDVTLVDWTEALAPALLLGLGPALVLVLAAAPLRRYWPAWVGLPFLLLHGAGTALEANSRLDSSPGEHYSVPVLGKDRSGGRTTTYWLRLPAWGPVVAPAREAVPFRLYQKVEVGDSVAVHLRPGALGIRWYVVGEQRPPDASRRGLPGAHGAAGARRCQGVAARVAGGTRDPSRT